jgi:hypothetical protein
MPRLASLLYNWLSSGLVRSWSVDPGSAHAAAAGKSASLQAPPM